MDLEAAADALYAGSPDDFVERRKALVAQARAAKDRALATAIGKLRRPTRSAWLVNLYAREERSELTDLLDLGAALQAAQAQLSGPELRRLSGQRQKTLAATTRRAAELGEAHGYTATEAVRQEVTQTLQAALADPDIAEQVRTGTVTEAHTYGGFGVFGLAATSSSEQAPETPAEPDRPAAAAPDDDRDADDGNGGDEDGDAEEDRAQRAAAEQRLQEAESTLSAAADEAEEATAYADELADRVESLRAELTEAEAAETQARQQARSARKRVTELESAVRAAREAYESLR